MLVLVALTTLSFMAKDGVTLRLKPQQGKTYTFTSTAKATTVMEVQNQSMTMSQVYESKQSFTVKNVTDTQSDFEAQIDAIKISVSQMGMKLEYDSEHPEKTSPMLAGQIKAYEETLKKPVDITYNALGQPVGDSLDAFQGQLKDVIINLPEEELTVGSKWTSEKSQSVNDTEITVNMEYTVTAISKKSVDVSFTGHVESTEVVGAYDGTASIDPKTGLIMSSTTKSNITMTLNEQGLSIPIAVVGTATVELK